MVVDWIKNACKSCAIDSREKSNMVPANIVTYRAKSKVKQLKGKIFFCGNV